MSSVGQASFAPKARFFAGLVPVVLSVWLFVVAFTGAPKFQLWAIHFNAFALLSAAALLVDVALMVYFYTKPARTEERTWLFIYMLSAALFSGAEMMQRLSISPIAAGFWGNFVTMAAVIPAATFMFTLSYTNPSERRYPWLTAALLLFPLIYVFFVCNTDIVYVNTNLAHLAAAKPWGWDFTSDANLGPANLMVTVWYLVLNGLALGRLISFRRHTKNPILRKQSMIFIWAFLLPVTIGTASESIVPLLGFTIPPFAAQISDIALILIVYGIVKYQLLTVNPTLFSNTILGIMQESVVVTDDKFDVVYLNPKAEAMLGIKAEASDKTSLLSVMQRSSAQAFEDAFNAKTLQPGGEIDIDQIDLKPVHAGPVPVRVTGSRLPLYDLNMWVIALSDITKELQTRSVIEHEVQVRTKELQEARAYLLSSINSLEQGFVLLNAKLGVEVINGAAQKVFGVKSGSTEALTLSTFVSNITNVWDADLSKAVQRVLETKRYYKIDVATKDGFFLQVFLSPILLDDHILGVAVIIQDVTEQRILDRSKDEFFSIASHELRTPLTAIRGNMSMIREYFPAALKDQGLADMVSDTHDASVRLIAIVNDFLDSSRLEQGKMQFTLQPVSLAPIIESVQKDLSIILEKQKDKVSLVGLQKLPKVMVDEGRVRQIVYNLVSNAAKYSQNATITVTGAVSGDKLKLSVADTGKGISPENQKLLFHKFQQAGDPLTRDDTKGTGLGLYISKLLAKNMHGDVELAHSEEGKGSTFVLTLPVAKK